MGTQLDLPSLTFLSVASRDQLQLGVAHLVTSVSLREAVDNDPTKTVLADSPLGEGRLAIEGSTIKITFPQTGGYICVPARGDLVHCTLGNPLTNSTGPMHLAFKPAGFFDKRFIHFTVHSNSTSHELTPEKALNLVLEISKRAELSITG